MTRQSLRSTRLGLLLVPLLAACAAQAPRAPAPAALPHDNLNATVWMQDAAEYDAALLGAYAQARQQLDLALADPLWNALPEDERRAGFESLPPAIIADADETLIDNSPFQARGIRDNAGFSQERWTAWVNERRAQPLPGALEFAQYADSRGVTIFYVTNRDAPAEQQATIDNLRSAGFPVADDASNVLLRGDSRAPAREKGERRRLVGQSHRVVMMLGDNLGDFLDGIDAGSDVRDQLVEQHAHYWGRRWIMLPNPSYGSWESAVLRACGDSGRSDPAQCKRSALHD
jgi:5'-nucleotidase (lipoprotein e(P4) family)